MTRTAQLLFALLGLWGGAFAWNRTAMPRQERVARLTYTEGQHAAEDSASKTIGWPDRGAVTTVDRRVSRDLFRRRTAAVVMRTPEATPTPTATSATAAWRYVGFVADGSGRKILLSGEGGVASVGEGDLLPGGWRLERIEAESVVIRDVVSGTETIIPRGR